MAFLIGIMALPAAIGVFTIIHWLRPPPKPVDRSNVLNRIRLWWFALTRQDMFIELCPWLLNDEKGNIQQ